MHNFANIYNILYYIMSYSSAGTLELISAANSISLNGAPGFKQILSGTGSVPNSTTQGVTITFSKPFDVPPIVVATANSNGNNYQMRFVAVQNVTTTSFDAYGLYYDFSNGVSVSGTGFYWIAIG